VSEEKETPLETVMVEVLNMTESIYELVQATEYQRMRVRDIITNALMADIHLGSAPNYHKVLSRIADVLNVALLPSLEEAIEREDAGGEP
jgi:hypothetical protein